MDVSDEEGRWDVVAEDRGGVVAADNAGEDAPDDVTDDVPLLPPSMIYIMTPRVKRGKTTPRAP